MRPIKAPLNLGQMGDEVANLQDVLMYLVGKNVIVPGDNANVSMLADEREKKLYGSATGALVQNFVSQNMTSGPDSGVAVTEAVAAALDEFRLGASKTIVFSGQIRHVSGKELTETYSIVIKRMEYLNLVAATSGTTDAAGNYRIVYDVPEPGFDQQQDFEISVRLTGVDQPLLASRELVNVTGDVQTDLLVNDDSLAMDSEYQVILDAVNKALARTPPAVSKAITDVDLTNIKELQLLAGKTGEDQLHVSLLIRAHQLEAQLGSGYAKALYGLFRQNVAPSLSVLISQPPAVTEELLNIAIAGNIIPVIDAHAIALGLPSVATTAFIVADDGDPFFSATYKVAENALADEAKAKKFLELAAAFNATTAEPVGEGDTEEERVDFWEYIAGDPELADSVAELKRANMLHVLTGGNTAITNVLYDDIDDDLPENYLAGLDETQVRDMVETNLTAPDFQYPDFIQATGDAAIDEYAQYLFTSIRQMYPTQALKANLDPETGNPEIWGDTMQDFKNGFLIFTGHDTSFDLKTVPAHTLSVDDDALTGIDDKEKFITQLGIVQRLVKVTDNLELVAAMAEDGLHSAMHIAKLPPEEFISGYTGIAGSAEKAQAVYEAAASTAVYNYLTVFGQYDQVVKQNAAVLDSRNVSNTAALADWRSLFGSIDSCNCSHCQSVYSPAAYLTDLLQFLRGNLPSLYEALQARRPDIIDIELTCKNINTPVPHIDIVNELLEDLVSTVAATGGYAMYARQTNAEAGLQRAIPEYVNTQDTVINAWNNADKKYTSVVSLTTPYSTLKSTNYPAALPYDYYKRQIDAHLNLTGVKGYELLQRFGEKDELAVWKYTAPGDGVSDFCAEYLGIPKAVKDTIIDTTVTNPYVYYGFKRVGTTTYLQSIKNPALRGASYPKDDNGNAMDITYLPYFISSLQTRKMYELNAWTDFMAVRVDVFLQQAGITYKELLQLLDCYTINPKVGSDRKLDIVKNAYATEEATCDLTKLCITGLDAAVMQKLYRFILLRKALGWSYMELDKALMSQDTVSSPENIVINEEMFVKLAQVHRLCALLKLPVTEVILFWKDIDLLTYTSYEQSEQQAIPSEYDQLFRNPLTRDIDDDKYPFKPGAAGNLSSSTTTAITKEELLNYLAGALHLNTAELQVLFDKWYLIFTGYNGSLSQLSELRRHTVLMKALKLKAGEWLQYLAWLTDANTYGTGEVAPFSNPHELLRCVSFVHTAAAGGVHISDVAVALIDAYPDPVVEVKYRKQQEELLTALQTGLNKLVLPEYQASDDADGAVLGDLLLRAVTPDKAKYAIQVITGIADADDTEATGPEKEARQRAFLEAELLFLSELDIDHIFDGIAADDALQFVYDRLKAYVEEQQVYPFVVSLFAKTYKIDEDIVRVLLLNEDVLQAEIPAIPAIYKLLDQEFLTYPGPIKRYVPLTPPAVGMKLGDQFGVVTRFQKAAWMISKFRLDLDDVINLWDAKRIDGIFPLYDLKVVTTVAQSQLPAVTSVKFDQWLTFLRWVEVLTFVGKNNDKLYEAIAANSQAGIVTAYKMPVADVEALLGNMSAPAIFNSDLTKPATHLRIIDCLEQQHLMPATMRSLISAAAAVAAPSSQEHANEVIQIVKAQYDDAQWLEAIRPVNDKLRTERRDALVAWLLANPPAGYTNKWITSNDIFETLMLDVDMMSCMATTRVLLAVNTVQLWTDRVLLGLERDGSNNLLQFTKANARQWQMWRKLYRVWEANRKIFVYPENWIEPELRDQKTPFFVELEKYLKQNELTDANVEEAYRTYLERLDDVAHLDIVALYRETAQADYRKFSYAPVVTDRDTIHVFGRTPENPHIYYYRKRVADEWTAWEKMDVQIDGDHFIPVMWKGRLRFYWLTFMKEQAPSTASDVLTNEDYTTPASTYWKINLAWSEYKNKKWTAKQVSKDTLSSFAIEEESLKSLEQLDWYLNHHSDRCWYPDGTLEKQKRQRINFYCQVEESDIKFYLVEKIVRCSTPRLKQNLPRKNTLTQILNGTVGPVVTNETLPQAIAAIDENDALNDTFVADLGRFVVKFNGVSAVYESGVADSNMLQALKWVPSVGTTGQGVRFRTNTGPGYVNKAGSLVSLNYAGDFTKYRYLSGPSAPYTHTLDAAPLLGVTPDFQETLKNNKFVILPRILPEQYNNDAIAMPYFFYEDYKNTFFVEQVMMDPALAGSTGPVVVLTGGMGSGTGVANMPPIPGYRFHNFHHDGVAVFQEKLFVDGLDGLLDRAFISNIGDSVKFRLVYQPKPQVMRGASEEYYPDSKVDFSPEGAFSMYNWELFFHIPMLIANKLSQDQKFEAARKWYHYVFNPTVGAASSAKDFWNFPEFYRNADMIPTISDIMKSTGLADAVARWANDPFKPHLVAKTRVSAYMKNAVMKYLDNLVAWGDMLFRTDTRENINEATLLYVLAAQLMGRRPEKIPAKSTTGIVTYRQLKQFGNLNAFSNALLKIENQAPRGNARRFTGGKDSGAQQAITQSMYYFCFPTNDKLAAYWDIIADRLFKIRHCQNIDGIERDLALYDPPIDPALLVKAAAAGLSLADALNDINAPLPYYRFNVMSQKATELTHEVKSLGGQLLSAIEKRDSEHIALLRSSQELTMLELVTEVKEQQIQDAVTQVNGLQQQQKSATQRRDYYKRLIDGGLNVHEALNLSSMMSNLPQYLMQGVMYAYASIANVFPNVTFGAFSSGVHEGGNKVAAITSALAQAAGTGSNINSTIGQMASTVGSFARRKEDWEQQLKTTETELKQIDQQILGAQIRKAVAEMELRNHKVQLDNSRAMDEAMHEKFSNEELYEWMLSELSVTYFQAYKLALEVAKRAERCYRHELGIQSSAFIQPAYWDSLRKGLLAGEQLMYDIKRMEVSFLEKNKRHLELTKHISLATAFPDALTRLKFGVEGEPRSCTISIPEWLYDMDYPGHHLRRIKSVSISIPCVAGPYTTVSCKLSLLKSKYRKVGTRVDVGDYPEVANADERFSYQFGNIQSIATSHAQNDSGMFEFSFRDERYLPFEGAGAISDWKIELPAAYAQFDYASINDVILHVNYTSLDEGGLRDAATAYTKDVLQGVEEPGLAKDGFYRIVNVGQEFATGWHAYGNAFGGNDQALLKTTFTEDQFPYFCKGRAFTVGRITAVVQPKFGQDITGCALQLYYEGGSMVETIGLAAVAGVFSGSTAIELPVYRNTKIVKLALTAGQDSASDRLDITEKIESLYFILHGVLDEDTPGTPATDDEDWDDEDTSVLEQLEMSVVTFTNGNHQVTLNWTAVTGADSYIVKKNGVILTTVTDTTYTATGLTNGTSYTFSVTAAGEGFRNSDPKTVTGTPNGGTLATPTLTATPGNGKVTLSWTSVADATSYTIEQSLSNTFSSGVTTTYTGTVTPQEVTVANGTHIYFRIKATAAGYTNSAYGYDDATPSAPGAGPLDGISNIVGWWMADAGDNLLDGSDNVLTWKDQSGAGNDMPAVTAAEPALISNWKNSKPALHFNGAQALRSAAFDLPSTNDITVIMVGEKVSSAGGTLFQLGDSLSSSNCFAYALNDGGKDEAIIHNVSWNINYMPASAALNVPAVYVVSFYSSDPNPETAIDFNDYPYQTAVGGGYDYDTTGVFTDNSFNIGSSSGSADFAGFKLAEMIVLGRKTSGTELTTIKSYLKDKYGF